MWFPEELWRIIKNYQLGQNYWKRKFTFVLQQLPKSKKLRPKYYSSATKKTQFLKSIERIFLFNKKYIIVVFEIFCQHV
tara:strand:- start:3750 stop:3986 length:237 start_codon:yes stop_codon:yes gene_type:complete